MKKPFRQSLREHVRAVFLSGLLLLVPLVFTYLILKSLFLNLDHFAEPAVRRLWGISFPGLGILLTLLFLYGVGLISSNILGRTLLQQGERLLLRIPLVKIVYQSLKDFLQLVFQKKDAPSFRGRVVLVEYPMKGFKTLGLLTNQCRGTGGRQNWVVFVPTVPNPTSGFLGVFPEEEVFETNFTLEEAFKFFFSAGILELRGKA